MCFPLIVVQVKVLPVAEDRRTLLKVLSVAVGGATAAAAGVPVLRAALDPLRLDPVQGGEDFVPVAALASIPAGGEPVLVPVVVEEPKDAWNKLPPTTVGAVFLRRTKEGVRAWSSVCPHLGCGIDYAAKDRKFACPCHESSFDLDGSVEAGPSPRGMDELPTRVDGERVLVRFAKFALGTQDKVET